MRHAAPQHQPASKDPSRKPELPHEQDETSRSQASGTPQQKDVGRKAWRDATDGSADTDRGPVMDQVYNDKVAPDRGPEEPRQ